MAHIDLSTPCILGKNGMRRARKALLEKFGLENNVGDWRTGRINICHLCACNSSNGWCENLDHLYIGTPTDNSLDKDPEVRKAAGKVGAAAVHAEKNEDGQSINAVRAAEASHAKKNEKGQSINAVRAAEAAHAEKNEEGKSVNAVKAAGVTHAKKNEQGQSINAVKAGISTAAEKNEDGRSINALKMAEESAKKTRKPVLLTNTKTGHAYIFSSIREAARRLRLSQGCLSQVLTGRHKQHKGFIAQFV